MISYTKIRIIKAVLDIPVNNLVLKQLGQI